MTPDTAKRGFIEALGGRALAIVQYLGGTAILGAETLGWLVRGLLPGGRFSWRALAAQIVRVGARSVGIVVAGQLFIGVILALQIAPPLEPWGQVDKIADIIGIGGFRMLGPIITAIILTGFAGASMAAELGTMVVGEEIEAMEAMALNPVRFLVVPRVLATFIAMLLLTIIGDVMIGLGGYIASRIAFGPDVYIDYWKNMRIQLAYRDFVTGLIQAGVFGLLISLIACYEGLRVRGGAEGVGRATTMTVVYSIIAIILSACIFTVIFYVFEW